MVVVTRVVTQLSPQAPTPLLPEPQENERKREGDEHVDPILFLNPGHVDPEPGLLLECTRSSKGQVPKGGSPKRHGEWPSNKKKKISRALEGLRAEGLGKVWVGLGSTREGAVT